MTRDALERRFEGCKLTAYNDPLVPGVWTIGYGHTGKDVFPGLIWTQAEAEMHLQLDVNDAEHSLKLYSPQVMEPATEALTDFVFNLGIGNYRTSTLCKFVNAGKWALAKLELGKWDHANGIHIPGLHVRRQAEVDLLAGIA